MKNKELKCYDCNKEIIVKKGKLVNGVGLLYKNDGKEIRVLKCKDCYKKSKTLTNFQECLVYDRVVGYYQPTTQWNPGKIQELKNKKRFKI